MKPRLNAAGLLLYHRLVCKLQAGAAALHVQHNARLAGVCFLQAAGELTLAGSVLRMNRAVQNMVEKVGVPFTQAVDYATINPARMLKIDKIGRAHV